MTCSQCGKREATVFFDVTVNNQNFNLALCETCAQKKGMALTLGKPPFSITDLMAALGETSAAGKAQQARALKCPNCGLRYSQFQQTGRLGCSVCYEAFQKRLRALINSIHSSTKHSGKTYVSSQAPAAARGPGGAKEARSTWGPPWRADPTTRKEIERLKAELQRAVQKEDFEKAAKLRDKIRSLEK